MGPLCLLGKIGIVNPLWYRQYAAYYQIPIGCFLNVNLLLLINFCLVTAFLVTYIELNKQEIMNNMFKKFMFA